MNRNFLPSCCLAYPLQRTGHVCPAPCPGRVLLQQVATVFTRAPWVRTPQQVIENLFPTRHSPASDAPAPPRPENKRVWASLLKGKTVIQEVAEEAATGPTGGKGLPERMYRSRET